jgi:hypothetical protein
VTDPQPEAPTPTTASVFADPDEDVSFGPAAPQAGVEQRISPDGFAEAIAASEVDRLDTRRILREPGAVNASPPPIALADLGSPAPASSAPDAAPPQVVTPPAPQRASNRVPASPHAGAAQSRATGDSEPNPSTVFAHVLHIEVLTGATGYATEAIRSPLPWHANRRTLLLGAAIGLAVLLLTSLAIGP